MFTKFPTTIFDKRTIVDITRGFTIEDLATQFEDSIYFQYTMRVWRSPENIAYDFYEKPDLVYLVYLANNIINPFTEWFLKDNEVKNLAVRIYGEENIYKPHHYLDNNGNKYHMKPDNIITKMVSNIEYETELNEERRTINIIYPELVPEIEDTIETLMRK